MARSVHVRGVHERNFGFLIHDVARLIRVVLDQRVRDMGLTRSQWWVLLHLLRRDGVTQSDLAAELEIGRPSLGVLLDHLERKGWIERRPDATDRRAKRVFLTPKVDPVMTFMNEVGATLNREALAGLPSPEQNRLIDGLLAVKTNLQKISSPTE